MMTTTPCISLTAEEQKLFTFLLDVVKQNNCNTTLRVAGGWVRDKLLGRTSDDIDIVLDNMTGSEFAAMINQYETQHGHVKHKVGIIKANPEQSKHLETATIHLGIGWVDFVNLRAETYAENSRIPDTMCFGSPQQDAERRDFTINSLFYNINTSSVEDFTSRGLDDLNAGLIRTPLEPHVTFIDDPIRALRAIRFASRFDFTLEQSLQQAIRRSELTDALLHKVSRERVGKELMGMITGSRAHPARALGLLHTHGLSKAVFYPPAHVDLFDERRSVIDTGDEAHPHTSESVWIKSNTLVSKMHELIEKTSIETDGVHLRILSAVLVPMASLYFKGKKGNFTSVPTHVIRESLKLPARDDTRVTKVLQNFASFQAMAHSSNTNIASRVKTGILLRNVGPLWSICRDVGCVVDQVGRQQGDTESDNAIFESYNKNVTQYIKSENLEGVWDLKPLINGKELMQLLNVKPGPVFRTLNQSQLEWQLSNPTGTKDDCAKFLQSTVSNRK